MPTLWDFRVLKKSQRDEILVEVNFYNYYFRVPEEQHIKSLDVVVFYLTVNVVNNLERRMF